MLQRTFVLVLVVLACRDDAPAPSPKPAVEVDRRLTRAECVASVDHAIALLAADATTAPYAEAMRGNHATHVAQCLRTATVRDHDCLMKSKTARELGLCPMPGTR